MQLKAKPQRFQQQNKNMKRSGFKNKHSTLRKFRIVEGDDILQVNEADSKFSLMIRKRDKQCVNCGSTLFLGCSHYFSRGIYATRYDPLNCITLCQECHEKWEHEKNGIYKDYMVMWLGKEQFELLENISKIRVSPYEAITKFMGLHKTLQDSNIEY